MKVYTDPGHGGIDPGAVKNITEKNAVLVQSKAFRNFLELHGVTVKMSRTSDITKSLYQRTSEANKWGADYFVSFHMNAGGGDGAEVFHSKVGGKGKELGKNILFEYGKLGQNYHNGKGTLAGALKVKLNDRNEDYYAVIRDTRMPAIIVETAFVDSKDSKIVDEKHEQETFGYAAAKGLLKTAGIKVKMVYVTLSELNLREKPDLNSKKLDTAPKGTLLVGTEVLGGWLKTTFNGKSGYVRVKGQKVYCERV